MNRDRGRFRAAVITMATLATLLGGSTSAVANEPPSVEVTIDRIGTVDKNTGEVTISGTMSCTGTYSGNGLYVEVRQITGRFQARGEAGFFNDTCNSTWTAKVSSWGSIAFGPGPASVEAWGYASYVGDCWWDEEWQDWVCDHDEASMTATSTVRLKNSR